MKKLLFFFPLNPLEVKTGSQLRAYNLLKYFKSRNFSVDVISEQNWGDWNEQRIADFKRSPLIENLYIFRHKPLKKNPLDYFFKYKIWHLRYDNALPMKRHSFPNHATYHLQVLFDNLMRHNKYDYVLFSYLYWSDLLRGNVLVENSTTIVDTHDFMTAQHQNDPGNNKEVSFADELRRLALFDRIWAISPEEKYLFSNFFGDKVDYIPPVVADPSVNDGNEKKEYDFIYAASDNPHNIRAARWFFSEVYPLIPASFRFCVVGSIVGHIPAMLPNVISIGHCEDIDFYYRKSRVALCPMLSGTGVKIKVIEAMAHGIPVVCQEKGLDGLPNKLNNGCLVSREAQDFAQKAMKLIQDQTFYAEQSKLARRSYIEAFSEEVVYARLDTFFFY